MNRAAFLVWVFALASLAALVGCANGTDSSEVKSKSIGTTTTALYTSTATIAYDGGADANPGCSVCSGDFSEPGLGSWNGGSKTFADPTPANLAVTAVTATLRGVFANPVAVDVSLNAVVIGSIPASADAGAPSCGCDTPLVIRFENLAGLPGFVKGGSNTFAIDGTASGLRLSSVSLAFEGPDSTTTTLTSVSPSPSGGNVVLTATVATAHGVATGDVTFLEGANVVATATLDGAGRATTSLIGVADGTHAYTASYPGATGYLASSSNPLNHRVAGAAVNVAVTLNPTSSLAYQIVTAAMVVTPVASRPEIPTGDVVLKNGSVTLGTARLNSIGRGTLMLTNLPAGSHTLVATTTGDTNFAAGTGSASITVGKGSTTLTLAVAPTNAGFGQNVGVLATIVPTAPARGTPTGTVTFFDGTRELATSAVFPSGEALYESANFERGVHSISARYNGSINFDGSTSTTTNVSVGRSLANVSFSTTPPSPKWGDIVTVNGLVLAAQLGSPTPTGTLTFYEGSKNLGMVTLVDGIGSVEVSGMHAGMHTITAEYSGDTVTAGDNNGRGVISIGKIECGVTLTVAPAEVDFGEVVGFRATVRSAVSGPLRGPVEIRDGLISIGVVDLDSNGVAVLTATKSAYGSHLLTAEYPGDGDHLATVSQPAELFVRGGLDPDASVFDAAPTDAGEVIVVPSSDASSKPDTGAEPDIFDNTEISACACRSVGTTHGTRSSDAAALGLSSLVLFGLVRVRRRR